jgi:hypothetical protein
VHTENDMVGPQNAPLLVNYAGQVIFLFFGKPDRPMLSFSFTLVLAVFAFAFLFGPI